MDRKLWWLRWFFLSIHCMPDTKCWLLIENNHWDEILRLFTIACPMRMINMIGLEMVRVATWLTLHVENKRSSSSHIRSNSGQVHQAAPNWAVFKTLWHSIESWLVHRIPIWHNYDYYIYNIFIYIYIYIIYLYLIYIYHIYISYIYIIYIYITHIYIYIIIYHIYIIYIYIYIILWSSLYWNPIWVV